MINENGIKVKLRLTPFIVNIIDDLIGIWGENRDEIIQSIIEKFFFNEKNLQLIEHLRKSETEFSKKKLNEEEIHQRLSNLFTFANDIPIDFFCEYLHISKREFYDNLANWSRTYKFKWINSKIIKT